MLGEEQQGQIERHVDTVVRRGRKGNMNLLQIQMLACSACSCGVFLVLAVATAVRGVDDDVFVLADRTSMAAREGAAVQHGHRSRAHLRAL